MSIPDERPPDLEEQTKNVPSGQDEEWEKYYDPTLPEDPSPGPFVVSPFTAGKFSPKPGQPIAKGL